MGIRRDILRSLEAGVMGLFFIQSIRFLYGTIYAHASSADLTRRLANPEAVADLPGYITIGDAQREIYAVAFALLAPLLALFLSRLRWSIPLAVALGVVGRMLALQVPDSAALAAAMTVGAGVLYLALVIMRRPGQFPSMLILGIAAEQFIRATNTTIDPTWDPDRTVSFGTSSIEMDVLFIGVAIAMLLLSGFTVLEEIDVLRRQENREEPRGALTGWSSLSLGAFLFIELTLFGLPNVVARWADVDYFDVVVPMTVVTLVPLIPLFRRLMGTFIGSFVGTIRGWMWLLLVGFTLVIGYRFDGTVAVVVLIAGQLFVLMTLWWMIRIQEEMGVTNPTPILLLLSLAIFGLLSAGDYFTYDYAFVRDFSSPLAGLDDTLRSFRDLGLQVFLFATILLTLPMILEKRVIPWRGGREGESFVTLIMVLAIAVSAAGFIQPNTTISATRSNCYRVATLNIHSGFTLLFDENVERIAESIQRSGADIVLLQETDAGRLSSYGIDQPTWLANKLGMDKVFVPQNEYVQGLTILTRVPVTENRATELSSTGAQGMVQHAVLDLQGQPLHVYNVWLGFQLTDANGVPLPPNLQDQLRHHQELRTLIANNHSQNDFRDRIVLGGTFNYDMFTDLYRDWSQSQFEDPFIGLDETRDIRTVFLIDGTSARFDYLWLMNLRANSPSGVGIDQEYIVSDHRLAVVEMILNPNFTCDGDPISTEADDAADIPEDSE
jgi:exonuclease III